MNTTSNENELCFLIDDINYKHEIELLKLTHSYEMKLNEYKIEILNSKHEIENLKFELKFIKLSTSNETILEK